MSDILNLSVKGFWGRGILISEGDSSSGGNEEGHPNIELIGRGIGRRGTLTSEGDSSSGGKGRDRNTQIFKEGGFELGRAPT